MQDNIHLILNMEPQAIKIQSTKLNYPNDNSIPGPIFEIQPKIVIDGQTDSNLSAQSSQG